MVNLEQDIWQTLAFIALAQTMQLRGFHHKHIIRVSFSASATYFGYKVGKYATW